MKLLQGHTYKDEINHDIFLQVMHYFVIFISQSNQKYKTSENGYIVFSNCEKLYKHQVNLL